MTQQAYTGHSGPYIVVTKRPIRPMKCDYDYTRSGKPCRRDASWEFSSEEELYCTQHAKMYELRHGRRIEWGVSRRAFATLDGREVWNALYGVEVPSREDVVDAIAALPDSGGTVGPLPDGTLIEVEPVDVYALGEQANVSRDEVNRLLPSLRKTAVVVAFNAAQAEGLMT